jgi:hypothetical protein
MLYATEDFSADEEAILWLSPEAAAEVRAAFAPGP